MYVCRSGLVVPGVMIPNGYGMILGRVGRYPIESDPLKSSNRPFSTLRKPGAGVVFGLIKHLHRSGPSQLEGA